MQPLAERLRPKTLEQYIGQEHLVGKDGVLSKLIKTDRIPSMILWGPPGTGKTTLARIIANETKRAFSSLSAISSGVKDVREAISKAKRSHFFDQPGPILFIDEIHRFNKAQQDALLGAVEEGTITLIGATTENPSFEVISALLSRCQVYTLKPLSIDHFYELLKSAREDEFIKSSNVHIEEIQRIIEYASGDARRFLNLLEVLVQQAEPGTTLDDEFTQQHAQVLLRRYDKTGDQHYDMASAMIKSIRGSHADGALYWMARMLDGGEDIKFIVRRLIISASEDIGLANPNALLMANQCAQAIQFVGMPEARIILSQTIIYLAGSPKSNSAYQAIDRALALIDKTGSLPVPLHLRNAPTGLMKNMGYGKDYKYSHDYEGSEGDQLYLPDEIAHEQFYYPKKNTTEDRLSAFISKKSK